MAVSPPQSPFWPNLTEEWPLATVFVDGFRAFRANSEWIHENFRENTPILKLNRLYPLFDPAHPSDGETCFFIFSWSQLTAA